MGGKMSFESKNIKRRDAIRLLGGVSLLPLLPSLACSGKKVVDTENDIQPASEDTDQVDTGVEDTNAEETGNSEDTNIDENTGWATGGTAGMREKNSYPDPFSEAQVECALIGATTLGPCIVEEEFDREDVSEGWDGVPLRLGLKIVDGACNPIVGAKVKIWHTSYSGSYSGETPHNDTCLMNQDYASQNFFRGNQTTDENGVVFFDTCFPGWYPGRVIHIHFQVIVNSSESYASQLLFPEDIAHDICGNHALYAPVGLPDVNFSTDGVLEDIPASKLERNILEIERMSDGAMLGWKVLTISEGKSGLFSGCSDH